MNEHDILHEAARLQAARRRRVTRTCDVCGKMYEGLVHRRYCSDRCRVEASRQRLAQRRQTISDRINRSEDADWVMMIAERLHKQQQDLGNESRSAQEVVAAQDDARETVNKLIEIRDQIMGRRVLLDDSTEILRREREARSRHQANL